MAFNQYRPVVVCAGVLDSEECVPVEFAEVVNVGLAKESNVISGFAKHVGNRRNTFGNCTAAVINGAGVVRVEAGKDRRAGRQAESVRDERVLKRDAFSHNAVLVWGGNNLTAHCAQTVPVPGL